MCPRTSSSTVLNLTGFSYPKLHEGKNWYVDFYVIDPATDRPRRKKYMLDNIRKIGDRRRRAAEIIQNVTTRIHAGWNPWVRTEETRAFTLFEECLDKYLEYISRDNRKSTIQNYTSRVKVLREYQSSRATPIKYVYQFDSAFVTDFLDWIYLDREASPRTTNNYRAWCYGLAEFFKERKYIKENPAEHIKHLKEEQKKRKDLSPHRLKEMRAHLNKVDRHFLLACLFEYYTFIRPTELSNLRVGDISIKEQKVHVKAEFSKNKRDGYVGLNKSLIKLMVELGVFSHPSSHFLFGKGFKPGERKIDSDDFNRRWRKMRTELKWKDCYQFYSLKDSGIRDLANSEGIVVARDQARHADVTTTNRYLQGNGDKVYAETLGFTGAFEDENPEDD